MRIAGSTTLVTGASSGFGREIATELLARGGKVVAAARDPTALDALVAQAPNRTLAVRLDVTRDADATAAAAAAIDRFGAIDALVNNAGYGFLSTIEEADEEQVRAQFETNMFGPIRLMRAVLPAMRARRRGLVVNVSSTAGSRGLPGSGYYCASKAALEALTESLALEAAHLGLRAMIVCPGPFRTDFFGRSLDTPRHEIADYAVIAEQRRAHAAGQGGQRGDPVRGARLIVDAMESDDPPLRLPLGGLAYHNAANAYRAKLADLARSEAIAPLADHPDGE